jgi:pilus assembly protein CpaC
MVRPVPQTRRHRPWIRLCVCMWAGFGIPAHAQLAPSGGPPPLAPAIAAMARSLAGGALVPGLTQGGPGQAPAAPGIGPMVVTVPRTAAPAPAPAPAPDLPTGPVRTPPHVQSLALEAGTGRIVSLSAPAATVFAADPRVAEVRPASPTSLFVLGIAQGRTTIAAIDDNGAAIAQYDVIVQPSSFAATQAQGAIARQLPGHDIRVVTRPNGLVISGTVQSAAEADQVMQTARDFAGAGETVESRLAVLGSQQVNLRVRIAEVSRSVMRQLGVNWSALGNIGKIGAFPALGLNVNANSAVGLAASPGNPLLLGANFSAVIDALAQDSLAHVLAEPNLTAMSGETASFLVGGEFPIPVAQQNNQVSIEFKQYGISLAFVPTVISGGRINMKVRPEVSALSTDGAVRIGAGNNSIQVPALTVRRAETTVELASGQSFAIAGLLQDSTTMTGNGLPGLGELPILGALFRSDSFQRNETELVIVITPYLVGGVADPNQVKLPTDGWKPPRDLERLLLLRQSAQGQNAQGQNAQGGGSARGSALAAAPPNIPGDAGFVVQ